MDNLSKYQKLLLCILFDGLGYISFIIPLALTDVIWAPLSAYLITKLFKGKHIKTFAFISFIEEALPLIDVIPTFTITWLYTYIFASQEKTTDIK